MAEGRGYNYMYNEGPSPAKPLMLIGMAVMGIVLPWYFSYEPVMEEVQQQWGLLLLLLPLLLLLALIFLASSSSSSSSERSVLNYVMPASDPSSIHRVSGSPVGLALLLVLIFLMIWYHSDFIDSWNPLIRS